MLRGQLITGRTGLTDPHKLNKIATEIEHRIISEYYELKKPKKKQAHLNVLRDRFLIDKSHLSINTQKTYKSHLITFLDRGLPKGKSKSHINAVRRDYNIFARWCQREGFDVKTIKGDLKSEARMRILTRSELDMILSEVVTTDFRDCIEFIYYTGARRKEVNAPKEEWLRKNDKGEYYLQVIKKGGYKRIIRINSQALEILKRRDFQFWGFGKQWLTRGFKMYSRNAGIDDVILHDLRRTFGYNILKKYRDISMVSRLLGISLAVADRHYTPLLPVDIEDFSF